MKTHETLRELRESKNMTQQNVADLLNIGRTMYRRYETGEIDIPVRHLKKLCVFYDISSDYVLDMPEGLRSRVSKTEK